MDLEYTVHRVSLHKQESEATLPDGTEVIALVDTVEVELVPEGRVNTGTIKLSFVGAEAETARDTFEEGEIVAVTFEPTGESVRPPSAVSASRRETAAPADGDQDEA